MINDIIDNKKSISNKIRGGSFLRKQFGQTNDLTLEIPCLTTIQTDSYNEFLQKDVLTEKRLNIGIQEILNKHFPVSAQNNSIIIKFISYHLDEPKYSWEDCKIRGINYAYPIRITFELIINEDGINESKIQDIYIGEIPAMTKQATFIINGVERVLVSQLHRAPGVFFDAISSEFDITYLTRIIPKRGIWLDFEIDEKKLVSAIINKKKVNIIHFLLSLTDESLSISCIQQILEIFYSPLKLMKCGNFFEIFLDSSTHKLDFDILSKDKETVAFYADTDINHTNEDQDKLYVKSFNLINRFLLKDLYVNNLKIEDSGYNIDQKLLDSLPDGTILEIVYPSSNAFILNSLKICNSPTKKEAILKLCAIIKPNESIKVKNAEYIVTKIFFDANEYSLSNVGRVKLNEQIKSKETSLALTKDDIIRVLKKLINVALGEEKPNQVDSLSLRRVRPAGELAGNQFEQAILKLIRSMQDKMLSCNKGKSMLDFINSRHCMSIIKDLWLRSSLSQQLSETNPLASLTHKRRISCYGAGGLQKDRVSTELRELDATHYGRICVSETPEGQSVGLVMSCTVFAKINDYGFICSPYKKVVDGKITNEIVFLTSSEEENYIIAHYDTAVMNADHSLSDGLIACRKSHEYHLARKSEIDYIDISPKQILSISASLIPFIENDSAVRTVMGANMQRQALPLINPEAPLIGTGMEEIVVRDSNSCIFAKNAGKVTYVSSNQIIIQNNVQDDNNIIDNYKLTKFHKSNDGTCVNHSPCASIREGTEINVGDIIAQGHAVDQNEIALGRNVKVAFLSYRGANFEDAIVISSKLAQEFKSIGLSKFEISIMEHKQGIEQFTRELPNINESLIVNLDASGIINIGSYVKPDDVLIGRITPKAEGNTSPEERFLKVVFGGKSLDVKDTSLRVPTGTYGTVIDIKCFTRSGFEKNERILEIEKNMILEHTEQKRISIERLVGSFKNIAQSLLHKYNNFSNNQIESMSIKELLSLTPPNNEYKKLVQKYAQQKLYIENECEIKCKQILEGDSLPIGVLQTIQVFIATEYTIEPGDKLANRHGGKGIVSTVLSAEDMPFTKNGEPVDMVLTSIGISGRMNIGQIFETHLGKISVELGKKISNIIHANVEQYHLAENLRHFLKCIYDSTQEIQFLEQLTDDEIIEHASKLRKGVPFAVPAFEGPKKEKIQDLFKLADCDISGKEELYDGLTGDKFPQSVTVGIMYMMQLHHLVAKKEHARATGPYSLISSQPLGGRQQMGAQRLGEMEVWALQAYSASYTIHEMLTIKSDCTAGRTKIFELISQGYEVFFHKGIPESFLVLVAELKALCLNVECLSFINGELVPQDLTISDSFDAIRISPADRNTILSWSHGAITKPETIHYRTLEPHPQGILSTVIFGPTKDNMCLCGRQKGAKRKGVICSKCQTLVTSSKVRRHRMGHIELAAPVVHVWFAKVLPSRIATILDITMTHLNKILSFEFYCVISQGLTKHAQGSLISEFEYQEALLADLDGDFKALTGAEAIQKMLQMIDLPFEISKTRAAIEQTHNETNREKLTKRLKMLESFYRNNIAPDSMVITVLPVLPANLRPLVVIDGGRLASADLNELYLRVINRNNRLRKYIEIQAPEVLIRSEKRMLQEMVDAIFDNGRKVNQITTPNKRPLKSLADNLKGKNGRFRQNLLGKRVDYSGRSVIIVGPELRFNECGIPKQMALELFKPALLARLVLKGFAATPKMAKILIENKTQEVWDILYEITHRHVVLLNRAPTLHRLGIQAFYVVLIEGRAIKLHPLACRAYNADFDGDQMAVHALLSVEAQLEARFLMMSTKCILNPANSFAISSPTKDMILGLYDMTNIDKGFGADDMCFSSFSELEHAVTDKIVSYSSPIRILMNNKMIETTYGRLKLFSTLPKHPHLTFDLINKPVVAKDVQSLVYLAYALTGEKATVEFLDKLMKYGFEYATLSGVSFAYSDLPVPIEKPQLVANVKRMVEEYYRQYNDGLITEQDRHNKIIAAWENCTEKISDLLMNNMSVVEYGKKMNPIYEMSISGARGSMSQLRQLAGLKGIMVKGGEGLSENASESALVEGVKACEFVVSASSARKDLSDIAIRTAQSGHLNRRLIDVAQDCFTEIDDCGTTDGIYLSSLSTGVDSYLLENRIFGRTLAEDITDLNGNILLKTNALIDFKTLELIKEYIKEYDIFKIKVRSPTTCACFGAAICCKCYGIDLSNLKPVDRHVAVGIIAAQSIGEPGTQLTMKNFHAGGVAQNIGSEEKIISLSKGIVHMPNIITADVNNKRIVLSKNNILEIRNIRGLTISSYRIINGAKIYVKDGDNIEAGATIASWDMYTSSIIAEQSGIIRFKDLIQGKSYKEAIDDITGLTKYIVKLSSDRLSPTLILEVNSEYNNNITLEYKLQENDVIQIENNAHTKAGSLLATRIHSEIKSQNIITGLVKIIALFEARKPVNASILSGMSGVVSIVKTATLTKVVVQDTDIKIEHIIPKYLNLIVQNGDMVQIGDVLTDGIVYTKDILKIKGKAEAVQYFVDEVQKVYQSQGGATISDKHIEIIFRQMMRSATIIDPGNTVFMAGNLELISKIHDINDLLREVNKKEIVFSQTMHGITHASIWEQKSFMAAASFQDTTKVFVDAATRKAIDSVDSMKALTITGGMIRSGIGGLISDIVREKNDEKERYMKEQLKEYIL